ncbi:MAG: hypothetical protein AABW99_01775 [archaeon]
MAKRNESIEGLKQIAAKNKQHELEKILGNMVVKLREIEEIRAQIEKEQYSGGIPIEKSREMLEEIKVPSLAMIMEEKKKR